MKKIDSTPLCAVVGKYSNSKIFFINPMSVGINNLFYINDRLILQLITLKDYNY